MSRFPAPVSGERIPHGWFAALVRFVNSLVLRGDGRCTMVSHNESGTTVTLTPAVVAALERAAGAAPGSGAPQGISAAVSGGTLTLSLSGSTSAVHIVGAGAASITQDPVTGDVTLSVSGGTASVGFPDFLHMVQEGIVFYTDYGPYNFPVWVIGSLSTEFHSADDWVSGHAFATISNGTKSRLVELFDGQIDPQIEVQGSTPGTIRVPFSIPLASGLSISFSNGEGMGTIRANIYPSL